MADELHLNPALDIWFGGHDIVFEDDEEFDDTSSARFGRTTIREIGKSTRIRKSTGRGIDTTKYRSGRNRKPHTG